MKVALGFVLGGLIIFAASCDKAVPHVPIYHGTVGQIEYPGGSLEIIEVDIHGKPYLIIRGSSYPTSICKE